MATLTIKNLPDEIYAALSRTAKRNRRSINNEAIVQLERSVRIPKKDRDELVAEITENREKLRLRGVYLTDEFLEFAKNEGRP